MKKTHLLFVGLFSILLSSCTQKIIQPESLIVTAEGNETTIKIAESVQLTANITPSNASDKSVIWNSENVTVATVNTDGLVLGVGEGVANIKAISKADASITNFIKITVQKDLNVVYPTGVVISTVGNVNSLKIDQQLQFSAKVEPNEVANKTVTWSVDDTSKATIDSATGLLSAKAKGNVVISASANALPSIKATYPLEIVEESGPVVVNPTGITLEAAGGVNALYVGDNLKINVTYEPSNVTNKDLTWSSSAPQFVSVDATGLLTGVSAGIATITATSAPNNISKSISITATEKSGDIPLPADTIRLKELYTNLITDPEDPNVGKSIYYGQKIKLYGVVTAATSWYYYIQDGDYGIRINSSYASEPAFGQPVISQGTVSYKGYLKAYTLDGAVPLTGADIVPLPVPKVITESNWHQDDEFLDDEFTYLRVTASNLVYEGFSKLETNDILVYVLCGSKRIALLVDSLSDEYDTVLTLFTAMPKQSTFTFTGVAGRFQFNSINRTVLDITLANCISDIVEADVAVSQITVQKAAESLKIGQTAQIGITVLPDNATDKSVSYNSASPSVASVNSSGLITANGVGATIITIASVSTPSVTNTVSVQVASDSTGISSYSLPYFDECAGLTSDFEAQQAVDDNGNIIDFSSASCSSDFLFGYSGDAPDLISSSLQDALGSKYTIDTKKYVSMIVNINFQNHKTVAITWGACSNANVDLYLLESKDGGTSWSIVKEDISSTYHTGFMQTGGTFSYTRTVNSDVCRYAFVLGIKSSTQNFMNFTANVKDDNFKVTA